MEVMPVLVGSEENAYAKSCNFRQDFYLELAAKMAQKSPMNQKHGCVIVLDDEVLSMGHNYHSTHMYHTFSIHAEVDAINKINKKKYKHMFPRMELYVVRIGTGQFQGTLKYSKPCEGCQNAIKKYGICKIYYSSNYEYEALRKKMSASSS